MEIETAEIDVPQADGSEVTKRLNVLRDSLREGDPKRDLVDCLRESRSPIYFAKKYSPSEFAMVCLGAVYERAVKADTVEDKFYYEALRAFIPELAKDIALKEHRDIYYDSANKVVTGEFEMVIGEARVSS